MTWISWRLLPLPLLRLTSTLSWWNNMRRSWRRSVHLFWSICGIAQLYIISGWGCSASGGRRWSVISWIIIYLRLIRPYIHTVVPLYTITHQPAVIIQSIHPFRHLFLLSAKCSNAAFSECCSQSIEQQEVNICVHKSLQPVHALTSRVPEAWDSMYCHLTTMLST